MSDRILAGWQLLLALLLALWLAPAPGQEPAPADTGPAPRIGVLTMSPGEDYWARFGHNAILVEDPARGLRLSYNYGYFDFDQPGFIRRFLRGRMRYRLVVMPLDDDLAIYAREHRGVELQWLDLDPHQARSLADFLAWNARPENAEYTYDYFTDNCSTRVRDAIDRALGGALSAQPPDFSGGLSYRREALRLGADVPWLYLGMHAALGPRADRPLSAWDEAFVPGHLADLLARARQVDGRPLVSRTVAVLPDHLELERASLPRRHGLFAATGLGLALLLGILLRRGARPVSARLGAGLAAALWGICGAGGLVLLGLWAFTAHAMAWANQNLLLLNPLALLLLPGVARLWRNARASALARIVGPVILIGAILAALLHLVPAPFQDNRDFIALLGPAHAVLAWRLLRARA